MKPVDKQSDARGGFTIVELLTIISIIVILIGLLVPALNMVKRYAKRVNQKNQFHAISVGLETYNAEWEGYPPSFDNGGYCGAMQLAEGLVGQDMLGFHPESGFEWYDDSIGTVYRGSRDSGDLSSRRSYIPADSSNAYKVKNIYVSNSATVDGVNGTTTYGYAWDAFVICDMYGRMDYRDVDGLGISKIVGMPILYFTADLTQQGANIYNYANNEGLVGLGVPWDPSQSHMVPPPPPSPSYTPGEWFQELIRNKELPIDAPYNADSYILMSAGFDGLYGTDDDVFNFGM